MSEFLKPQSPLKHKDGAFIYPLTTEDQIIMDDGSRLSAALDDINSKIENIDFDNISGLENVVYAGDDGENTTATINADTLGGKTEDMLNVANADKLGGQSSSYYAPAVKLTPRNLLDNSDFTNPVNQRGQESYNGSGYNIDRWRTNYSGDTVSITSNGVKNTINSTEHGWHLHQIIEKCERLVGKTLTVAAKVAAVSGSGLGLLASFRDSSDNEISWCSVVFSSGIVAVSGEVPSGTSKIRVGAYAGDGVTAADYVELEWVALYEGEYTVETLPEYQPKGYSVELLECQRYYCTFSKLFVPGFTYSASTGYATIDLPVTPRQSVTFTISDDTAIIVRGNGIKYESAPGNISLYTRHGRQCRLQIKTMSSAGIPADCPLFVYFDGKLEFSAEEE